MTFALNYLKSLDRSLSGVTRLCLGAAAGCFLAGGMLLAAGAIVPSGPRGLALLFVGCFFLIHAVAELGKSTLTWRRRQRFPVRPAARYRRAQDRSESSEQAAA